MNETQTIYADYQATTPIDPRVLAAMLPHWNECFGNPHSSDHILGWRAAAAVEEAASSVAALVGADADQVIFTSGATEANNLALLGLARRAPKGRHRILISAIEHKCVLSAARTLDESEGFSVQVVPVDTKGRVDLAALSAHLDETVLAASIMAVNNEIGTIQEIKQIAGLLRPYGILLHCDAAQAPCAMDVSDLASHADLVSLSGHKIYGPLGIGALCVRRDVVGRVEPLIYGGGQQQGLRSGTVPTPLCVGMATAARILATPEAHEERLRTGRQRDEFVRLVRSGPFPIDTNGTSNFRCHPGNANLLFEGFVATEILGTLQPRLAASTGSACSSGIPEPSHVLRAIGRSATRAEASIRFSFGRFTTDEEVGRAARLVLDALKTLVSSGVQCGFDS